jgi:hypothetical protein
VQTEGAKYAEYRADLAPVVHEVRDDLYQYPWKQGTWKKVINDSDHPRWQGTKWVELLGDSKKFSKVAKSFAVEAVLRHPVVFTRFVLKKFAIALSKLNPDPKFGPKEFWRMQEGHNESRWKKTPAKLRLLYGRDQAAYDAMVQERLQRPVLLKRELFAGASFFDWFRQRSQPGGFPTLHPTWYAALGTLGILYGFLRGNWRRAMLLVLPCFFYLTLVYTVGDSRPRYLVPVEWIGLLYGALGVELLLYLVGRIWRRGKASPSSAESAPQAAPAGA